MSLPIDGARAVVERFGCRRQKFGELEQHAVRDTGPEASAIRLLERAFARDAAALDTGSAFEGMGAAREVSFACLAEAALFTALVVLVRFSGSLSLTPMLHAPIDAPFAGLPAAALLLVAAALFVVLLTESSRVPVDDPNTHLELTMIHEVIVLDHSGPDLALILYGSALKLTVFAVLVVSVFVPRAELSGPVAVAVLLAGLGAVAVAIGVVESVMARLRLTRVPQLLVGAAALALFAIILQLQ